MTDPIIRKYDGNPILKAEDLPYPGTLAYNCGVCRFRGRYLMFFRVDHYIDNGQPDPEWWPADD